MPARVLVADDSASTREMVVRALAATGLETEGCASGEQALARLAAQPYAMLVTDHVMGFLRGAELLEIVRQRHPGVVRVMMTGYAEMERDLLASGLVHVFLRKPLDVAEVRALAARVRGDAG